MLDSLRSERSSWQAYSGQQCTEGYWDGYILLTNHRLLDEFLAKDQSLIAPFHTFLRHDSAHPYDRGSHHPAFVIEIGEDDMDTLVLDSQKVFHRYFDVVERDVCGTSSWRVTCLDC